MSMEYAVEWSREAIYDVAEIADYIEARFGVDRADQFVSEIDQSVGKLSYTHVAFSEAGLEYRGFNIRKLVFIPSVVFYTVDEAARKVLVRRVLRHERDWQSILREQTHYTFDS